MLNIYDTYIGRMYGPNFLFFYAAVGTLLVVIIRYVAPQLIAARNNKKAFEIPNTPNPYEIAFLQGADGGAIQLALFSLVSRDYFTVFKNEDNSKVQLKKKASKEKLKALTPLETAVYNSINSGDLGGTILSKKDKETLQFYTQELEEKLKKQEFVWGTGENEVMATAKIVSLVFFIALGFYKLLAAFDHGHKNVGFIWMLGIVGVSFIYRTKATYSPSAKGAEFVRQLQAIFKPISGDAFLVQANYMQNLLIALYGIDLLADSKYAYLKDYMNMRMGAMSKKRLDDGGDFFGGGYFDTWTTSSSGCSGGGSSGCGSSCGGGCGGGCGGCS